MGSRLQMAGCGLTASLESAQPSLIRLSYYGPFATSMSCALLLTFPFCLRTSLRWSWYPGSVLIIPFDARHRFGCTPGLGCVSMQRQQRAPPRKPAAIVIICIIFIITIHIVAITIIIISSSSIIVIIIIIIITVMIVCGGVIRMWAEQDGVKEHPILD